MGGGEVIKVKEMRPQYTEEETTYTIAELEELFPESENSLVSGLIRALAEARRWGEGWRDAAIKESSGEDLGEPNYSRFKRYPSVRAPWEVGK